MPYAAEQFVSEQLKPVAGSFDSAAMAAGEPGLPGRFVWRGAEHEVAEVLERWKESSPCRNGADEIYLRKHWYRLRTAGGLEMKVYFERQPRSKSSRGQSKARWWVYTVAPAT